MPLPVLATPRKTISVPAGPRKFGKVVVSGLPRSTWRGSALVLDVDQEQVLAADRAGLDDELLVVR